MAYNRPIDTILVLGTGGLSLMSRSSRQTPRKHGCGTAVTGTRSRRPALPRMKRT